MQSIFELKNPMPFDADMFECMKNTATEALKNVKKYPSTQAIALHTSNGKIYCAVIADATSKDKSEEKAFLDRVKNEGSVKIDSVLCMWEDGGIDIPSFTFRKMLCDIEPQSTEASLFVMTKDGPAALKLESSMR